MFDSEFDEVTFELHRQFLREDADRRLFELERANETPATVAETTSGNEADGKGKAGDELTERAPLSVTDLSKLFDVPPELRDRFRKRLERWRKKHDADWPENPQAASRDTRILYRADAVKHIALDILAGR